MIPPTPSARLRKRSSPQPPVSGLSIFSRCYLLVIKMFRLVIFTNQVSGSGNSFAANAQGVAVFPPSNRIRAALSAPGGCAASRSSAFVITSGTRRVGPVSHPIRRVEECLHFADVPPRVEKCLAMTSSEMRRSVYLCPRLHLSAPALSISVVGALP
jgi:hypothetical protein